jgi:hypothetical protein
MVLFTASRTSISLRINVSSMTFFHVDGAVRLCHMCICLCFSFLSQVLTRRDRDTMVSWKIESRRGASAACRQGASAACTGWIVPWMKITKLVRIWRTRSADGCDRCGVLRGESRIVRPL